MPKGSLALKLSWPVSLCKVQHVDRITVRSTLSGSGRLPLFGAAWVINEGKLEGKAAASEDERGETGVDEQAGLDSR